MTYYHLFSEFNEGYDSTETESLGFFHGYPSLTQLTALVGNYGLPSKKIELLHSAKTCSLDSTLHFFIEEIVIKIGEDL